MAIIQKLSAFLGSAKQEARAPEQRVVERAVAMPEPVEATLNALAAEAGTPVFHPVPHYRIRLLGHLLGTPQTGRKLSPVVPLAEKVFTLAPGWEGGKRSLSYSACPPRGAPTL